jgi:hypothetical protein
VSQDDDTSELEMLRARLAREQRVVARDLGRQLLENPDADLTIGLQRLETYEQVLALLRLERKWTPWLPPAIACFSVLVVGALWLTHLSRFDIVLDLDLHSLELTPAVNAKWKPKAPLDGSELSVSAVQSLDASPVLGMASTDPDARSSLSASGLIKLKELAFERQGSSGTATKPAPSMTLRPLASHVLELAFAQGYVDIGFSVHGAANVRLGDRNGELTFTQTLELPEPIRVRSFGAGATPTVVRAHLHEPMRWDRLAVNGLKFVRPAEGEHGGQRFESSVIGGTITFPQIGRTEKLVKAGRLKVGAEGTVLDLVAGDSVSLVFRGVASDLSFDGRNLAPRWLEFLVENRPVTVLWAALAFVVSFLWSAVRAFKLG